jgi:hypothetical protein
MPNKKYQRAAAMERRVRDAWIADGYIAARSAGSHSAYDVYAVKPTGDPIKRVVKVRGVEYITYTSPVVGFAVQCKRHELTREEQMRPLHDRVSRPRRRTKSKAPAAMPVHSDSATA